ncbi:hypothetical protein [Qipengyuania sediminis]|uniref:hypothetical protein n=1 Tax=Qipengyuania sediminis TaxID=1532023 RepID=UPI00105A19EE|nr:hypothetical protein [Qipengyuania sediminis]
MAAADRALAIDPTAKGALKQKRLALFAAADKAEDERAAYAKADQAVAALNRLEPDHPYGLIYTIQGHIARGEIPPQPARNGLVRAAKQAPFDLGLALQVGQLLPSEGAVAAAIGALQPVAANPHGEALSRQAKRMIAFLQGKPEGVPVSFAAFYAEGPETAPDGAPQG